MSENTEQTPPSEPELDQEVEAALEGKSVFEIAGEAAPTGLEGDESNERMRVGTIVDVGKEDVIVEFGPREQGVVPLSHFAHRPSRGTSMRFWVERFDAESELFILALKKEVQKASSWDDLSMGMVVNAKVVGHNKGGLDLECSGLRAFMPFSQISLERIDDPAPLVGETWACEVIELNPEKKRLVLSRRVVLEREREESRRKKLEDIGSGDVVTGTVSRLESFGAFVDIGGGVEGLVHISNLALSRVERVEDVVKIGDVVRAKVLEIKDGGKRIGLGIKQLQPDPWDTAEAKYAVDSQVTGKVTRVAPFGAFVEVEPGLEGLVHISQLSDDRVTRVDKVVQPGATVTVRVLAVNRPEKRLSLSMRSGSGSTISASSEEADDDTVRRYRSTSDRGSASQSLGALLREAMDGKRK